MPKGGSMRHNNDRTVPVVILVIVAVGCASLFSYGCAMFAGCGSSSSTGSTQSISTNATTNKNLLTSFTGSNSVAVAGTWTNSTFSTTGDVAATITFNSTTNVATIVFDIDGSVYGGNDPAAETFTLDMTNFINNGTAALTATSGTYGDISVTLTFYNDNTGTFSGTAVNEPTGQVTNATFTGTFSISGSNVSLTINDSHFDFNGVPVTCSNSVTQTLN